MLRRDESNTLDGINNNTYEMLFIDDKLPSRLAKDDREFIMSAIQEFTKLSDKDIDYVINNNTIFLKNGKVFEVNKKSKKYKFSLLDYFLTECKDELRSEARLGKCTETSISFALGTGEGSKVLIGYADYSTDKFLHAVYLDCSYDKEYVFDYTMNIVMEKEQYLDLMEFKIINEVNGEDIIKDREKLKVFDHFGTKFYLCFRDEIMKDLEKNKKVLKLED